ncbi:MAG TPA: SPOR domain-containing protein, partial [Aestuariivirgaceae bacterium]|nr:SPOR domain-containing protein [Aestuariivirgaceae bacterium]
LPRVKPEPPAGVRTAAKSAPQAQPQRQSSAPQPSGSGPVKILPADLAPNRTPAEARAAQQPQTQQVATFSPRAGTVGREFDPLAGTRSAFSGSSFSGSSGAGSTPAAEQTPQAAPQQVASAAPDAVPSQSESAGGYVVQLTSFRSESDALSEFQRLVQRHPQLLGGLDSRVQQASLGQSGTFYRLGIGPVADRNTATKLCNNLIAAGEKDCLVRRN